MVDRDLYVNPQGDPLKKRRRTARAVIALGCCVAAVVAAGALEQPTSVDVGQPSSVPDPSTTSAPASGSSCPILTDCAVPAAPRSVALDPVPDGFSAVTPGDADAQLATMPGDVVQTYLRTAATVPTWGGAAAPRLTVRISVDPGRAHEIVASESAGWAKRSLGSRSAFVTEAVLAGPSPGTTSSLIVALSDDLFLFARGEGVSAHELFSAVSTATIR